MSCGTLHVMYVWVDVQESFLIQSEQLFWPTKCLKAAHDFPKICTPLVWESRRWQIPRCRGSKRVGISTLAAQTALGHHILMVSYHVHDCHDIAKWKFHWKRDTSAWLIPLFTANFRKSPAPFQSSIGGVVTPDAINHCWFTIGNILKRDDVYCISLWQDGSLYTGLPRCANDHQLSQSTSQP